MWESFLGGGRGGQNWFELAGGFRDIQGSKYSE